MSKPLVALFVLGAVAIGLLILLLVGSLTVEEDGVENDGAAPASAGVTWR